MAASLLVFTSTQSVSRQEKRLRGGRQRKPWCCQRGTRCSAAPQGPCFPSMLRRWQAETEVLVSRSWGCWSSCLPSSHSLDAEVLGSWSRSCGASASPGTAAPPHPAVFLFLRPWLIRCVRLVWPSAHTSSPTVLYRLLPSFQQAYFLSSQQQGRHMPLVRPTTRAPPPPSYLSARAQFVPRTSALPFSFSNPPSV